MLIGLRLTVFRFRLVMVGLRFMMVGLRLVMIRLWASSCRSRSRARCQLRGRIRNGLGAWPAAAAALPLPAVHRFVDHRGAHLSRLLPGPPRQAVALIIKCHSVPGVGQALLSLHIEVVE